MPALPIDTSQIVITASRAPESEAETPASVTIIDSQEIERLDEPLVTSLLRLTPSAAVTSIGPAGSLTEVRIRGSEANHTLLFVDGIKINDPASGDAPRFELLNADLASRIEVVRGPQSALWGSDAIGGVIAVNGLDDAPGYGASAEGGSFGFADPDAHLGYAYVMNKLDFWLFDDPREKPLRDAVYRAIARLKAPRDAVAPREAQPSRGTLAHV